MDGITSSSTVAKMTSAEDFRAFGTAMIDYVIKYLDTIRERRVLPSVEPGYLQDLIPEEAPLKAEKWKDVLSDIERVIMPGVTHWQSPHFHGYFPTGNSFPSIVADILSDAIGCVGFSWIASPVCTELEMLVMNWLGKMLALPEQFLFGEGSPGGGVIQGSACESTLMAMLSAKAKAIARAKASQPDMTEGEIVDTLIAYGSKVAHSSVERAGLLAGVHVRLLDYDEDYSMRGDALERAIEEDRARGRVPFYVAATLGSTACLSFDNLVELGPVCEKEGLWLHIDAAYAGSAFICPEYRPILNGIEHADSFTFNPHKWLLVNFDCSALYVRNANELVEAFHVNPSFLQHKYQGQIPDYRHWQIPLSRRFRSLKLWFVLRLYGQEGLRKYIRNHVKLAHEFRAHLEQDSRFEIVAPVTMGLVCFRLKGPNKLSESLIKAINDEGKIHLTQARIEDQFFLRLAICAQNTTKEDISFAYDVVCGHAERVLKTRLEESVVIQGIIENQMARGERAIIRPR